VAGNVTALRESRFTSIAARVVALGSMPLQLHRAAGLDHAVAVGDVAQQLLLRVVDQVAVAVELELAVARVFHRAVAIADLEEAGAVDGQVQRVAGGRDVALRELLRHRLQGGADAHQVGAGAVQRGGIDRGELGARHLGAIGVGVGNVVADDLEVLARGVETG